MATWKKVIVSGSAAELLNVTASAADISILNVTEGSGSFSGSFQGDGSGLTNVPASGINLSDLTDGNGIADFTYDGTSPASVAVQADGSTLTVGASGVKVSDGGITSTQLAADSVTLGKIADGAFAITASGDVAGQATISSDSVSLGLTIQAGAVENSMLVNDSIYLAGGNGLTGDGSTALGASGSLAVGAGNGISVSVDAVSIDTGSSHFTAGVRGKISVTDTTGAAGIDLSYNESTGEISGSLVNSSITIGDQVTSLGGTVTSFSGSFQGDGSGLTNVPASGINLANLTDGNGIADFTYDGTSPVSVAVEVSGSTLTVGASGVAVATGGVTSNELASNSVTTAKIVDGNVTNAKLANSSITLTADGGTNQTVSLGDTLDIAGGTNITTAVGATDTVTINLDSNITVDNITTNQDLTVSGDLTVLGTASFQNTTNLEVADRFILLASGSNTTGDGGIIVQQATQDVGEAFFWDIETTRWGVADAISGSTSAATPDAFMAAAINTAGNDPNGANDPGARYNKKGNLYVASDSEDIWIYS